MPGNGSWYHKLQFCHHLHKWALKSLDSSLLFQAFLRATKFLAFKIRWVSLMILLGNDKRLAASLMSTTRHCSAWWPGGLVAWWTSLGTGWLLSIRKSIRLPLMAALTSASAEHRSSWWHDWTGIRSQLIHLSLPRRQPTCLALASFPLNHFVHLFATRYLKHRTTRIKNFKTRLNLSSSQSATSTRDC